MVMEITRDPVQPGYVWVTEKGEILDPAEWAGEPPAPVGAQVGDIESSEIGSAARYNSGKPALHLIPLHLLEDGADVLNYGAKKYAEWNWAKGQKYSVALASLKRHIASFEMGEDLDEESCLPHLGHMMANILFLTHFRDLVDQGYEQFDDRPTQYFLFPEEPH